MFEMFRQRSRPRVAVDWNDSHLLLATATPTAVIEHALPWPEALDITQPVAPVVRRAIDQWRATHGLKRAQWLMAMAGDELTHEWRDTPTLSSQALSRPRLEAFDAWADAHPVGRDEIPESQLLNGPASTTSRLWQVTCSGQAVSNYERWALALGGRLSGLNIRPVALIESLRGWADEAITYAILEARPDHLHWLLVHDHQVVAMNHCTVKRLTDQELTRYLTSEFSLWMERYGAMRVWLFGQDHPSVVASLHELLDLECRRPYPHQPICVGVVRGLLAPERNEVQS